MVNQVVTPLLPRTHLCAAQASCAMYYGHNGNGERLPHWEYSMVFQFASPIGSDTLLSSSNKSS